MEIDGNRSSEIDRGRSMMIDGDQSGEIDGDRSGEIDRIEKKKNLKKILKFKKNQEK